MSVPDSTVLRSFPLHCKEIILSALKKKIIKHFDIVACQLLTLAESYVLALLGEDIRSKLVLMP